MTRISMVAALCAVGALLACGSGNPLGNGVGGGENGEDGSFDPPTGGGGGGGGGGGVTAPGPRDSISRSEPFAALQSGYVEEIIYDPDSDTFTVNDIAFDGDTSGPSNYSRDDQVPTLDPIPASAGRAGQSEFAVYENADTAVDPINGDTVGQFEYRAVYGETPSGNSRFAIVRTGSYIGYGFGGFVYERDGGVTIPTTGQGRYEGEYAGLRDFSGAARLEYVQGRASVAVDFEDFDNGDGLRLTIQDRRVLDLAGTDITASIITAYNAEFPDRPDLTTLPTIIARVGEGAISTAGVAEGTVFSTVPGEGGATETFEDGNYYAVLSGDNATEIAGVLVVTSDDPRFENVTVRETGGFLVYR